MLVAIITVIQKGCVRMHKYVRAIIGIGAALLLCASTASANRLSVNESRFHAVWSQLEFNTSGGDMSCAITLTGSFNSRTFNKAANAQIGHITSAPLGACTSGSATVLAGTLPWTLHFESFTGRLPNLSGIRLQILGRAIRISPGFVTFCLFTTTTSEPAGALVSITGGDADSIAADASFEIDMDDQDLFCDVAGDMNQTGSGSITTASSGLLTFTLI